VHEEVVGNWKLTCPMVSASLMKLPLGHNTNWSKTTTQWRRRRKSAVHNHKGGSTRRRRTRLMMGPEPGSTQNWKCERTNGPLPSLPTSSPSDISRHGLGMSSLSPILRISSTFPTVNLFFFVTFYSYGQGCRWSFGQLAART